MFCGGCFAPTVRCDGQLRLDKPQTSSNRRGKPFRNRRKGAFALCNGTCRRPFALFCGFLRQGESCPPNVRGKSERPFRSCAYISKTERCLRSVFCLRLIAEKQTCFCGLKIVILPFCPKACGSLLPTAFLTCAKKRVISENCPYSGRYSTKSSASFWVNSIKTSMGSVCFLSTRSSNISATPFCSAESCCVCSTTISSGLK